MNRRFYLRAAAVVLATALGLWLIIPMTYATAVGSRKAAEAERWWPQSEAGLLARAEPAFSGRLDRARLDHVEAGAVAALNRQPVSAAAARVLGMVAAAKGDQARARRAFAYGETLSRRDLPTQLWLIEDAVQRNDIGAALTHYDRALRTSHRSAELLLPILVGAASDPAIARPLARIAAARPPWWQQFAERLGREGAAPAIMMVGPAFRLSPDASPDRALLEIMLDRLYQLRAYDQAYTFYRRAVPPAEGAALIRDGGFEQARHLGPFEWVLTQESGLTAVQSQEGQRPGNVLAIEVADARGGTVARQLLLLPPGPYRLQAVAGNSSGDELERPAFSLRCASQADREFARLSLPEAGPGGRRFSATFVVPPGCRSQWLTVQSGGRMNLSAAYSRPWLDDLAIVPSRPARR